MKKEQSSQNIDEEINNEPLISDVALLRFGGIVVSDIDIAKKLPYSKGPLSAYLNNKKWASKKFLKKFYDSYGEKIQELKSKTVSVNENSLSREADLSSIETGIKLNYVISMLAELQEKEIPEKQATSIVSKLQKLVQSDFENALSKLRT